MERGANGCVSFLCALLCAHLVSSMTVTELHQGLLQKKMELRITSKLWKVVITVEDSSTQWNEVMRVVTRLTDFNYSHMDEWSHAKLGQLRHRINHISHAYRRRQKRGLIDGIGVVAHSLFGLATDADIAELKEKIEENRRWQQKMAAEDEHMVR